MGLIYLVTNKINGKKYVGQTVQKWPKRKRGHESSPDPTSAIDRAIQKYGKENFKWEIIDESDDQCILDAFERLYISRYESRTTEYGYNIRDGGGNGKHSQATRQKISLANKGKRHKPKTIEKMRVTHKNSNKGFKNPMYNKKHTYEARLSMANKQYPGAFYRKDRNPEKKCWVSQIRFKDKITSLGYYQDPISASFIYCFVLKEITR